MALSFSFLELGQLAISTGSGWLTPVVFRERLIDQVVVHESPSCRTASQTQAFVYCFALAPQRSWFERLPSPKVAGGWGTCLRFLLEYMLQSECGLGVGGVPLPLDSGPVLLFAKLTNVLADGEGHQQAWNWKGASALKPCLKHSNVVKKACRTKGDRATTEGDCGTLKFSLIFLHRGFGWVHRFVLRGTAAGEQNVDTWTLCFRLPGRGGDWQKAGPTQQRCQDVCSCSNPLGDNLQSGQRPGTPCGRLCRDFVPRCNCFQGQRGLPQKCTTAPVSQRAPFQRRDVADRLRQLREGDWLQFQSARDRVVRTVAERGAVAGCGHLRLGPLGLVSGRVHFRCRSNACRHCGAAGWPSGFSGEP